MTQVEEKLEYGSIVMYTELMDLFIGLLRTMLVVEIKVISSIYYCFDRFKCSSTIVLYKMSHLY